MVQLYTPISHSPAFTEADILKETNCIWFFRPRGWENNMQWDRSRKRRRWVSHYQYRKTVPWPAFADPRHGQRRLGNHQKSRLVTWVCVKPGSSAEEPRRGLGWVEPPLCTRDWSDGQKLKPVKGLYVYQSHITGEHKRKPEEHVTGRDTVAFSESGPPRCGQDFLLSNYEFWRRSCQSGEHFLTKIMCWVYRLPAHWL